MNKLIKISISILIITISYSCNQNDIIDTADTPNSGWIEMAGYDDDDDIDTSAVFETIVNYDDMINIPVKLTTATNINGFDVNYNVELIDGFLDDTSILGSKTFSFKPATNEANITFSPVYSSGFYKLKFTLMSTDDGQFQVGLSDDSKPLEFVLNVTNFNYYDAQPVAFGVDSPAYIAKIGQIGGTTDQFSVDSLWGPNWVAWATGDNQYVGLFLNAGVITVAMDNTATVTGDFVAATGSVGSFDPATGVYDISFNEANLFNAGFTINTVFTPQQ